MQQSRKVLGESWVPSFVWRRYSERRLRFYLRVVSGHEMAKRFHGRAFVWRHLRNEMVDHYIATYGPVPEVFLRQRMKMLVGESAVSEYRAWAYRRDA